MDTSSISAPVRLRSAGISDRLSRPVGTTNSVSRRVAQQSFVDRAARGALPFESDATRQISLRVDIDEQAPA
jgi:hypothetical protein